MIGMRASAPRAVGTMSPAILRVSISSTLKGHDETRLGYPSGQWDSVFVAQQMSGLRLISKRQEEVQIMILNGYRFRGQI